MRARPDRPSPAKARSPLTPAIPILALVVAALVSAQELRKTDLVRGRTMLKVVKKELLAHYYDPTFHGLDLEARFAKAEQDLEGAGSLSHMFGIIAQAVLDLGDSHTRFIPPGRAARFEYGWRLRVLGETPYVLAVKPGSDAEAKGLKPGDRVLAVDGIALDRKTINLFRYKYFVVRPVERMRFEVQSPGGPPRTLVAAARIEEGRKFLDVTQGEDIWDIMREIEKGEVDQRFFGAADRSVLVWKLPTFEIADSELKRGVAQMLKHRAVVIDLRGNPGGYVDALTFLLGHFFDRDVQVGQPKGRKKDMKPMVARARPENLFGGRVVVVVDSESGSASELFARVMQLEKRGLVVGDRTAGAVMRSRVFYRETPGEYVVLYGISVTDSDVIMADGRSLEGEGVVPDVAVLPTGEDLAAGRDRVLARAVVEAGGLMSPEEAGKLFPHVWVD